MPTGSFNTEVLLYFFFLSPSLPLWNPSLVVLPIRVHSAELLSKAWSTDALLSAPSHPPTHLPKFLFRELKSSLLSQQGWSSPDVLPPCNEVHPFQHPPLSTSGSAVVRWACVSAWAILSAWDSLVCFSKYLLSIYFVPDTALRIQKQKRWFPPSQSSHLVGQMSHNQ